MNKKILHLTLHRKYFDAIAQGRKCIEFRENKPYWQYRLEGKVYDEIHFRNGYSPLSPFMAVELKEILAPQLIRALGNKEYYSIVLGKIIQIKNYAR